MTTVFKLADAGRWLQGIKVALPDAARAGLVSAAVKTVAEIQNVIIPGYARPPIDRRTYSAAWQAEPTSYGARIYNSAPHAKIVEYGARAENIKIGTAMIDALTEWVKRKGIGSTTATGRSGQVRVVKATDTEARGIAWAIAKSMQKRGIFNNGSGLGVLKKAMGRVPDFVRDEVKREIKKRLGAK